MAIQLTCKGFRDGDPIPDEYACRGSNISPPLQWSPVPKGTKSWVLICDDPDAPFGTWVHWVLYNLPASITSLAPNVLPFKTVDNGAMQGMNDFMLIGYRGPEPPDGTHRYCFKIYALDGMLDLEPGATKAQVVREMDGMILDQGQLMGHYEKR